jgi:hypothetical protein
VVSVVAVEGRPDLSIGAELAEELLEDPASLVGPISSSSIEHVLQTAGAKRVGRQLRVIGDVEVTGQHALSLGSAVATSNLVTHRTSLTDWSRFVFSVEAHARRVLPPRCRYATLNSPGIATGSRPRSVASMAVSGHLRDGRTGQIAVAANMRASRL